MAEYAGTALDREFLRHTLGIARANGYTEVEVAIGNATFSACLQPSLASRSATPEVPSSGVAELKSIDAPCVGYLVPGSVLFEVGTIVKSGDIVAEISALGIANDVESKVSGEIVEVLVEMNQPVQFGQPLALVRPQ